MKRNRFLTTLLVLVLAVSGSVSCKLKPRAGESDADFKARQKAVFVAQTALGLDASSDAVEILANGNVFDPQTRRNLYQANEQINSGLDVARDYLKNPSQGDGLAKVRSILESVREANRRSVFGVSQDVREQIDLIFEIKLFALESLIAVLEEAKQPTRADVEAKVAKLSKRAAVPSYLMPLISLARETGFEALRISRLTAADAWAKAETISALLHSKNAARLEALGVQVF